MESPNLHYHQQHHHHQLQDSNNNPLLPSSSSSSLQTSSPSCFGPTVTSTLPLTSSSNINLLNNHGNYMNKNNGTIDVCSRMQNEISVHPMISNSIMTQDFNYWGCSNNLHFTHDYGSSSSDSYPKFTDLLLQNSSSSSQDLNMMKNHDLYSSNINHVFPTINVVSAVEMNLEGSDLFPCGRFSGHDDYGNNNLNYEFTQMQQQLSVHGGCKPFNSSSKFLMEPFSKNGGEPLQKKSRSDSRASCPPIKAKKEKLGDRIAALQHLVAPFGKTDTASVLMEAIGYIKFLQNQVETLSVPYMKASHVKQVERTMTSQVSPNDHLLNKKEKPKSDLRSRGLCLVPFSCLSYVTDGGGGIWYQDFNGA